jgi:hypothetical protein
VTKGEYSRGGEASVRGEATGSRFGEARARGKSRRELEARSGL